VQRHVAGDGPRLPPGIQIALEVHSVSNVSVASKDGVVGADDDTPELLHRSLPTQRVADETLLMHQHPVAGALESVIVLDVSTIESEIVPRAVRPEPRRL
jgi:hypothetical protein